MLAFSPNKGSTMTVPVKLAAGPLVLGREPLAETTELSAEAGMFATDVSNNTAALMARMSSPSM
jgi:hypothetical protein